MSPTFNNKKPQLVFPNLQNITLLRTVPTICFNIFFKIVAVTWSNPPRVSRLLWGKGSTQQAVLLGVVYLTGLYHTHYFTGQSLVSFWPFIFLTTGLHESLPLVNLTTGKKGIHSKTLHSQGTRNIQIYPTSDKVVTCQTHPSPLRLRTNSLPIDIALQKKSHDIPL